MPSRNSGLEGLMWSPAVCMLNKAGASQELLSLGSVSSKDLAEVRDYLIKSLLPLLG